MDKLIASAIGVALAALLFVLAALAGVGAYRLSGLGDAKPAPCHACPCPCPCPDCPCDPEANP